MVRPTGRPGPCPGPRCLGPRSWSPVSGPSCHVPWLRVSPSLGSRCNFFGCLRSCSPVPVVSVSSLFSRTLRPVISLLHLRGTCHCARAVLVVCLVLFCLYRALCLCSSRCSLTLRSLTCASVPCPTLPSGGSWCPICCSLLSSVLH